MPTGRRCWSGWTIGRGGSQAGPARVPAGQRTTLGALLDDSPGPRGVPVMELRPGWWGALLPPPRGPLRCAASVASWLPAEGRQRPGRASARPRDGRRARAPWPRRLGPRTRTSAAVLGATRLAIRGLAGGRQPIVDAGERGRGRSATARSTTTRAPRVAARRAGAPVASATDVAVIPGLYLELGDSFVERLIGVVRRSRSGIRATGCSWRATGPGSGRCSTPGNGMVRFATEIAALASGPRSASSRPTGAPLARYLRFGYFRLADTPFAEVRKVAPGRGGGHRAGAG